ncbi:MAG: TonB-dependent receptor [Bacteroidales bacterium]|nr:TonB-dependent receptor [Bacteroidales bacterium]
MRINRLCSLVSVLWIMVFGLITLAYSQNTCLFVSDSHNKKALDSVYVHLVDLTSGKHSNFITDKDGKSCFVIDSRSKVTIYKNGYKSLADIIKPGDNKSYRLSMDIINISEISVTGERLYSSSDKSIYNTRVITGKEIENKAATNLTDLINYELNFNISPDLVAGSSNLSFAGLSGEHIKLLIDGVPLTGRINGYIDINQVNLNNIEQVEIVEGPLSVLYGNNSIGATINLITKKNNKDPFSFNASSYLESAGVYNFNFNMNIAMLKKNKDKERSLNFILGGGRNFFDGYKKDDSLRSFLFNPKRQYFITPSLAFRNKSFSLALSLSYFDELLINKGDLEPMYYYEKAFDAYHYTGRLNNTADAAYKISNSNTVNLLISWSEYIKKKNTYLKDLTNLNKTITPNYDDQDTTQLKTLYVKLFDKATTFKDKLDIHSGLEYNLEQIEGKRITGDTKDILDIAAYCNLKYKVISNLYLQPGFRYSYNSLFTQPLIYSVNLKQELKHNFTLRLAYGRGYRSPSVKELYLNFIDISHFVQGNVDLIPENSNNYSFNISHSLTKLQWDNEIKLFFNKVRDIISLVPADPSDPRKWTYTNISDFRSFGIEFLTGIKLLKDLELKAALSRTSKYENTAFGEASSLSLLDYLSFVNLSGSLYYALPKIKTNLTLYYKYNGKYPLFFYDENNNLSRGYINPYNNMDFIISRQFFNNKIKLTGGCKNLFNIKDVSSVGSTGILYHSTASNSTTIAYGRTYFIKLSLNIK